MPTERETAQAYKLFKEQKNAFILGLRGMLPKTKTLFDWKDVNLEKTSNWFIAFAPFMWGEFRKGFCGIHFIFAWYQDMKTLDQWVRLSVGVEKPLRREFADSFKRDVVSLVASEGIDLPDFTL